MRLLSILPGLSPPPEDPHTDQAFYYPPPLEGDLLLPVWVRPVRQPEILRRFGTDPCPQYRVGNFTYHLFPGFRYENGSVRFKLATFAFFLREGLRLSRKQKFDCICTYGWTMTGIAALLLARLTGSKLIVTLQGVPENAYRFNSFRNPFGSPRQDLLTRLARRVSRTLLHVVVGRADCARLLYPEQLSAFPRLAKVPTYVTHDFVPMSHIPVTGVSDGSVLLVGAPWFIKGVDLLIQAFRMIEADFPNARLKVMGFYPDTDFKELIGNSRQIEILKPLSHPETMKTIADCSVFVLASRTESLGRVLLEAMAAGKPVIAPKVGGIPHYVQHGVNGLLFECGDVPDLALQLRTLLSSPELQARLGQKGLELARTRYDEVSLGKQILDMVERTVQGPGRTQAVRQAHTSTSIP